MVADFAVCEGYETLALAVREHIGAAGASSLVVIDGFAGTPWGTFVAALKDALEEAGLDAAWYSTQACFLPPAQIEALLAPTLTQDPV